MTWLLLLLSLVTACAPIQKQPLPADWEAQLERASALTVWQAEGKLGLRSQQENGSAMLTWTQHEKEFVIVISGALGIGKNVLRGNSRSVEWLDNKGEAHRFNDPSAALEAATGLTVPLDALRYWIRGIPAPKPRVNDLQLEAGLAQGFEQAGWQLEFPRYSPVEDVNLPSLLRARNGDVTLTIALTRWTPQK